MEISSSKEMA